MGVTATSERKAGQVRSGFISVSGRLRTVRTNDLGRSLESHAECEPERWRTHLVLEGNSGSSE
jgi:hypothetical protein